MGEVWQATQLSLDRLVALKVIAGDIAANPGFEQRFQTEARMAARVNQTRCCRSTTTGRSTTGDCSSR